jgi:hypothetical protein
MEKSGSTTDYSASNNINCNFNSENLHVDSGKKMGKKCVPPLPAAPKKGAGGYIDC